MLQILRLFKRPSVELDSSSGTALVCEHHPPNWSPAGPSAHELRVAFGARHDDIHPDPHGFGGGRHHVVEAVVGLHTEGQRRVWALGNRQTITHLLQLFQNHKNYRTKKHIWAADVAFCLDATF